jgi:DNA-binding response OmpR family regulator
LLKGACLTVVLEPKKILVVEDEPDTAEMFAEMLRLRGYRVFKSYGSASAMRQLALEKPDAVVLDIMMPDISGLEVLHYMRRDPALEYIPVIVVSAKGLLSDIKTGMEAGATLYLTKPVAYTELIKGVENVIQQGKSKPEG